jgi:hypothetical protein
MIIQIKEKLRDNESEIKKILEEIGCYNIHKTSDIQFRFGTDDKGSGSGNSLFIDTLSYKSFSKSTTGDIITLVSEMKSISTGNSIRWLAKKLNIKQEYTHTEIQLPFGGFFKGFDKVKSLDETPPLTYDNSILNQYIKHGVSKIFVEDNISALTQEKYYIGYDILTNRISIPWFDETGSLIGLIGRLNKNELSERESKYLPIIPFNKSKALYGFYENYNNILNNGIIIVCESEKSSLKGHEVGLNNVVSLGGNNISLRQAKLIKSMFCTVIIALDEGMSLEHNIEQAKKVKINNVFFSNDVYIVDMNKKTNPYIVKDKISLLDLDENTIRIILTNHLIKLE